VLNIRWHAYPGVHSLFVDRNSGSWKSWIGKGPNWYGDTGIVAFCGEVNYGSAIRAKAERAFAALIPNTAVLTGLALYLDCVHEESGLRGEDATASTLTC
jgi:hypothetical protein